MNKIELLELVQYFQSLGREGGYWDFKRDWYSKKAELLLDIICMSNNLENRDAFIILGIQDVTMQVIGIENDPNKKDLNELSQFIYSKDFAVYTPVIDLQTIKMDGHELDIIIIRNTNHTPYYLNTDFYENGKIAIHHGRVYVRLNDRKAGVDRAVPNSCIEDLWKKRFGINLSIMERLSLLLDEPYKWKHDWGNKKYAYHEDFPEFRMQIRGEMLEEVHPSAAFFTSPIMYRSNLDIMYHSTVIHETGLWVFDGGLQYLPRAIIYAITGKEKFWYSYYDLSNIEGKLLTIFTKGTNNIACREPNYNQILIFQNPAEKEEFDDFLAHHFDDLPDKDIQNKYGNQISVDSKNICGGLPFSAFQVAKIAEIYKEWQISRSKEK